MHVACQVRPDRAATKEAAIPRGFCGVCRGAPAPAGFLIGLQAAAGYFAGNGWRAIETPQPVPADAAQRIETALRLLRDSGPLRVLSAEEARAASADYGLGPEALRVTVLGPDAAPFIIRFGATNPLGSARYAKVEGIDGVPMLPGYVAETWEQATVGESGPALNSNRCGQNRTHPG